MMADEQKTRDPMALEQNVYADVYRVLLGGMFVSSILFAAGMLRALLLHAAVPLSTDWVRSHYHWDVVWHGLVTFDPTVLMMVATVLLILTPIARVVVSIYAFWVDGDRKFVVVTTIVLAVIVLTIIASHFGLQ
jgi:uncharacterized membrane protein